MKRLFDIRSHQFEGITRLTHIIVIRKDFQIKAAHSEHLNIVKAIQDKKRNDEVIFGDDIPDGDLLKFIDFGNATKILIVPWVNWLRVIDKIGQSIVVVPIIRTIFAILLPTTSPTAISECWIITARIQFANSGSEVPAATTTTPMVNKDICNFLAKLTDPRIIPSAPMISMAKPAINNIKSIMLTTVNIVW